MKIYKIPVYWTKAYVFTLKIRFFFQIRSDNRIFYQYQYFFINKSIVVKNSRARFLSKNKCYMLENFQKSDAISAKLVESYN